MAGTKGKHAAGINRHFFSPLFQTQHRVERSLVEFVDQDPLKRPIKGRHDGIKQFNCLYCNSAYGEKRNLMNHIAKNCGTSITHIESTYSKVTTEMIASDITKGLGIHSLSEESKRKYMDKVEK